MNRDNSSTIGMRPIVVFVFIVVGFAIYFNNPSLNQVWSVKQQQQQKDKGLVAVGGGVHSHEFQFEKNYTNVKNAAQSRINRPVMSTGMSEMNHTRITTTMKLNADQFRQIDKSQFRKAPEFNQINGYINTGAIG